MKACKHHLTTDVLVIGGGIAGQFAAIGAAEGGADVLMAEMVKTGLCGMTARGMHQFLVALPDDDIDTYVEYTVKDCEYMIATRSIAKQQLKRHGIDSRACSAME